MKNLTILRHGKSAPSEKSAVDFDRPLTKRGRTDMERVVKVLDQFSPRIDWIVSSPAVRAQQSAQIVAEQMGLEDHILWEPVVYESGPEALLSLVERVPAEKQHTLIVGHNPTLEQMISGLCAGSVSRMTCSLPTSGVANIELQIMWWEQVRWGSGLLRLFLRPRLLRSI